MTGQALPATPPRDLAGEYTRALEERFERAAAASGERRHDLELAGLRLRLVFAGPALEDVLLTPFAHLAVAGPAPAAPDLTIRIFDSASTGVEAPPPAWPPLEVAPGANPTARLRSDVACVLAAAGTGALTAARPERGEGLFFLPDATRIAPIERASPLREVLQLLTAARGRWLTHAGAVGREGRGVLLVGRGGSGKSTLALSCALAGLEIVADDYVLLEGGAARRAHAMQSTAKLTADSVARLGLDPAAIDPAGPEPTLEGPAKALVDIETLAPGRLRRSLRVAAIVAPCVPSPPGAAKPAVRSISAAEGLRAVASSTLIQASFRSAAWLAALGDLARSVPSFALDLSPDPAANAAVVEGLVAELG